MIATARASLLAVLEAAGVRAYAEVPSNATPPMAVMVPSADWIVSGEAFGEFVVSFDVEIVAPQGANETITKALDDTVESVLSAIADATGVYASDVAQPSAVELNGGMYLGTTITVRQNLKL